jgi:hypothetical protein
MKLLITGLTFIALCCNSIIAKLTDANWKIINTSIEGEVHALAFHKGKLFAGGNFRKIGTDSIWGLAQYDGVAWSPVDTTIVGNINALSFDKKDVLYIGGDFGVRGQDSVDNIAMWKEQSIHAVIKGLQQPINAMAVDSGGNVFFAGNIDFYQMGMIGCRDNFDLYIYKWNGSVVSIYRNWLNLYPSTTGCDNGVTFRSHVKISALCFDTLNNLWVGAHTFDNGPSFYPTDFYNVDAIERTSKGIMCLAGSNKYSDSYWHDSVNCVGIMDSSYLIMQYSTLVDPKCKYYALESDSKGNLYIGGKFDYPCTTSVMAYNIAVWDGTKVRPVGSGTDGIVYALCIDSASNILYVGGAFKSAGGKLSPGVAAVDLNIVTSAKIDNKSGFKKIECRISRLDLSFSGLEPLDAISLYSPSGQLFRRYTGTSSIKLTGISSQYMLITVQRKNRIVFQKCIFMCNSVISGNQK